MHKKRTSQQRRAAKSITAQRARSLKSARGKTARKTAVVPTPAPNPVQPQRLITGNSEYRKEFSITSGLLDYFPDAAAAVAQVSFFGNEKHNPGQPMHHARGKSMDHADCIARHLVERGGFDVITVNGVERMVRHSAALAWRAMALCQEEIEREFALSVPRGATELPTRP